MTRDLANRKATSQAGVAIQDAVVAKSKVQIETAKRNIEMMTLRAPRDGYVNIQFNTNTNMMYMGMILPMLQVGDTIRAGMGVVQLPDMKNWEASARIAEADFISPLRSLQWRCLNIHITGRFPTLAAPRVRCGIAGSSARSPLTIPHPNCVRA